jgi:hypothetical protein
MADLVKQARDLLDGVAGERWCFEEYQNDIGQTGIQVVAQDGTVICDDEPYYPQAVERKNARFIAASRQLVPAMADRIEALEAALRDISDPGSLSSYGDPGVLRDYARAALEGK